MTSSLPANTTYGTVTGRIVTAVGDTPGDAALLPDQVPAVGTVTFTPKVDVVRNTSAKTVMVPRQVVCFLDSEGYLTSPADGVASATRAVTLVASDNEDISPRNWAYTVSFQVVSSTGAALTLPAFDIVVLAGGTFDLADLVPSEYAPVVADAVMTALVAQSASWAEQAQQSAEAAATTAAGITSSATAAGIAAANTAAGTAVNAAVAAHAGLPVYGPTHTDYSYLMVDPTGRVAENALGPDGSVPQWVLNRWVSRMVIPPPVVDYPVEAGVRPMKKLAAWGDSMTAGYATETAWPTICANQLGIPVYNGGIWSQTSTEIALRQGGLDVMVTFQNNTIPASGAVPVTLSGGYTFRSDISWNFPGTVAGVAGNLNKPVGNNWTFTRTGTGTAMTGVAPSRFVSSNKKPYDSWINVIWAGRNNLMIGIGDAAKPDILRDNALMVAALAPVQKRFLLLGISNANYEIPGHVDYARIVDINQTLKNTYPEQFIDIRRYMIDHGLTAAGITPTAADSTAISEDRIPPSLLQDQGHYNPTGYSVVGKKIADEITSRGWLL
jgi:lysophospholipase L1-like esterase